MNIRKLLYVFILWAFSPVVAIAQNSKSTISKRIACLNDSSQQYALYVPPSHIAEKLTPLLIFLDPAARGDYPVDMYHELADEYGIIMAGSYNSRNFSGGSSVESFTAIYNDVVTRYAIDPDKIWISGFSGGARAASSIAMAYPQVKGVIGCGAGFSTDEEISKRNLNSYAAIVGDKDMNYTELLDNSVYLDEKKINNILLTFSGGHSWPPPERFGLAIEWLMNNDKNAFPVSTSKGDSYLRSVLAKLDSGFLYSAWFDLKQLSKVPGYKTNTDSLLFEIENKKDFIKDEKKFKLVTIEEQNVINDFSIAFTLSLSQKETGDKSDWLQKVKRIEKMKHDDNRYMQMAGERCFDHCTRSCLEYYFQLLNTSDFVKAFNTAMILSYFMPHDADTYYYMSRPKAALGDKKQCEKWLKEAVKYGMVLNNRILQDPLLLKVLSKYEIKELGEKN